MRTELLRSLLLLAFCSVPARTVIAGPGDPVLWYTHPAQDWKDALPVGNGRLGAMVFGRVAKERIQLNEDTVWNGKKRNRVNPEALATLPEARRLLFEGRAAEAEALSEAKLVGIPHRQPPYQPLGDLNLEFLGLENASDYRRELNLPTGIVRVSDRLGKAGCAREVFSSAPAQAIVVRISCTDPGLVSFRATLARPGLDYSLFHATIDASRILQADAGCRAELENALKRIPDLKIGKYGQLQEWSEDYEENEPGMSHVSHLFALFPGDETTVRGTPELATSGSGRRVASAFAGSNPAGAPSGRPNRTARGWSAWNAGRSTA